MVKWTVREERVEEGYGKNKGKSRGIRKKK